jgi:hypothetical protein
MEEMRESEWKRTKSRRSQRITKHENVESLSDKITVTSRGTN